MDIYRKLLLSGTDEGFKVLCVYKADLQGWDSHWLCDCALGHRILPDYYANVKAVSVVHFSFY